MAVDGVADLHVVDRLPASAKIRGQESVLQRVRPAAVSVADSEFTAFLVLDLNWAGKIRSR